MIGLSVKKVSESLKKVSLCSESKKTDHVISEVVFIIKHLLLT